MFDMKTAGQEIRALGIPFQVCRGEETIQDIGNELQINQQYACLYFLGMSLRSWQCSEWWGQQETAGDYSPRIFVGDTVSKLIIEYEDATQEYVPLIFGVNVWNYDLYFGAKPWEKGIMAFDAPYDEPMRSDEKAAKLFQDCLKMRLNADEASEKATKWVYAHRVRDKKIKAIRQQVIKGGGVMIGGVTGSDEAPEWAVDESFYLRKGWMAAADALSRRLYQYRDEMPEEVALEPLSACGAPDIEFEGPAAAKIFTNVYRVNVEDMAKNKVTDDGMPHTSSAGTLNFGCYGGLGTYTYSDSYVSHVWTRDTGRLLIELSHLGVGERVKRAADKLHEMLYYPSVRFKMPHWKRIANRTYEESGDMFNEGNENDGHASIMMSIYSLYQTGYVDAEWLKARKKQLTEAAEYFLWQMENPVESNFRDVLFSHSETSSQILGGYDLYANGISSRALVCYGRLFEAMGEAEYARKLYDAADAIRTGLEKTFTMDHPRHGQVYTDTNDDCWTYEYKRFCLGLMHTDTEGYDMAAEDPWLFDKLQRTFDAQKESYYHPESGRQMGYGQGYLTLTALALDRVEEYTDCVEAAARLCYHHSDRNYVVPEGVIMDVERKKWFRNSDLGNAVQQAEIVKCARLMAGIDDLKAGRLNILPRLPEGWTGIKVKKYPVWQDGERKWVDMEYIRCGAEKEGYITALEGQAGYGVKIEGAKWDTLRVGPFDTQDVRVKGGQVKKISKIQNKYYVYIGRE